MKHVLLVFALLVCCGSFAIAKEEIALSTPTTPSPITSWKVVRIVLQTEPDALIQIKVVGSNGTFKDYEYNTINDDPLTKIKVLNKANLSTKSLERRILEQLQSDFPGLNGTITGTPD